MTDLEGDLQQLWLKIANKVGYVVAPKQLNGSPERGQFLLIQSLMFAELLPKLTEFIEDYHETHAHKATDGLCCACNKDELKIKFMIADELQAVRNVITDRIEGLTGKRQ